MANYPEELVDLLQQYMTDGYLTDKERAVLLRKAESLGVDKDEFDLYIVAEEQKYEQKADAIKRQSKGKLCPFCEASIPTLADKCPECGGNITPEATKELEEIIDKLEDALVNFKDSQNIARSKAEAERYIRKAELYYESNSKVQRLLTAVKLELKNAEESIKSERRRNLRNKLLTSKLFWWLLIMSVSIAMMLLADKIDNLLLGQLFLLVFFGGGLAGVIMGISYLKK